MTISISNTLTQRTYSWTDWKAIYETKLFSYQYDDTAGLYTIWGYDGPEVSICQIWSNEVPLNITAGGGPTKEQNDLDKADFEDNFKINANKVINKTEQIINTYYQTSSSNFFSPTSGSSNYYLMISLLNADGYYHHPPGKSKLKIYAINTLAAKTNTNDIWVMNIGVIVDIAPTTATITFLNPGAIYLSNVGVTNSSSVNLEYPLNIDCSVSDGQITNISGGLTFPYIPNIGSTIPIANGNGIAVTPQIGDVIVSLSCVSDIAGFTPTTPAGTCIFQSHTHYTVED